MCPLRFCRCRWFCRGCSFLWSLMCICDVVDSWCSCCYAAVPTQRSRTCEARRQWMSQLPTWLHGCCMERTAVLGTRQQLPATTVMNLTVPVQSHRQRHLAASLAVRHRGWLQELTAVSSNITGAVCYDNAVTLLVGHWTCDLLVLGSSPGWALGQVTVTKQYNLVPAKEQWCSLAGR